VVISASPVENGNAAATDRRRSRDSESCMILEFTGLPFMLGCNLQLHRKFFKFEHACGFRELIKHARASDFQI
jgi:hypothetical protein